MQDLNNPNGLNEIYNKYRENHLAHAYLIETNNINECLNDVLQLVKTINCEKNFNINCNACNLCNLITKNNLPSLKIVEPSGSSIKKSQIEELKSSFNTIPVYSKYNVYIIKNAEKLNDSSANAMLKFLEEPTPGIIGFFITNNKDVMIETIKSRCQSVIVNYQAKNILEKLNISEEEYESYVQMINKYLKLIAANSYINHKKEIINIFPEREQILNLFKIMFEAYYQTFLKVNNLKYDEILVESVKLNDKSVTLSKKLNLIANFLQEMSYNVNIELILDKFVIEMRGIENE